MTEYHYKATGKDGAETTGNVQAHSLQMARELIVGMNLDPIEIYESAPVATANVPTTPVAESSNTAYVPFFETIRLYAGWLLAWYALIYIVGSYQFMKDLPFRIPYAESLFLSPLVLSFTFAAYLFLLLSTLYKATKQSKFTAAILSVIGIALFLLYRVNVQ